VIIGLNVRAEARTLQYGNFQGRQFSGQILPLRFAQRQDDSALDGEGRVLPRISWFVANSEVSPVGTLKKQPWPGIEGGSP
jgi:hypothetical protein